MKDKIRIITTILIALAISVGIIASGSATINANAATDKISSIEFYNTGKYKVTVTEPGRVSVRVFEDSTPENGLPLNGTLRDIKEAGELTGSFAAYLKEGKSYTVYAKWVPLDCTDSKMMNDFTSGEIAKSEILKIDTISSSKYPAPTNLRWEGTKAVCDIVPDANVKFWIRVLKNGQPLQGNGTTYTNTTISTDYAYILEDPLKNEYTFEAYVMTEDIAKYSNSDIVKSEAYSAKNEVNSLNQVLSGEASMDDKLQALSSAPIPVIQTALKDENSSEKIKEFEAEFASANQIEVKKTAVASDIADVIDINKIDTLGIVTGLGYKASNKTVQLSINKVLNEEELIAEFRTDAIQNIVGFEMSVEVDGEAYTNSLSVPVKMTMAVPKGMNADKVYVFHKTKSGIREVLNTTNNGNGTVTFYVTSFSPFAFGEQVDTTPTPTPTPSPTKEPTPGDVEAVKAFVNRLYSLVLSREADVEGLADWTKKLVDRERTGSEVALGFFASQELKDRNLSDEEYVKICYRTMLNREADESGLADWVGRLENGTSRVGVLYGFTNSTEFDNICNEYGIKRGTLKSTESRDQNLGITSFVARCYTKTLGRKYDIDGLNYWSGQILKADDKKQKAEEVASNGFFHSQEFSEKNTLNGQYVEILYRTFLGREYDEAGYNDWCGKLDSGVSRDEVLYGFSRSQEFSNIMAEYGL